MVLPVGAKIAEVISAGVKGAKKYVTPTCIVHELGKSEGVIGDIAKFSETLLKKPSAEKLAAMMKEQGLIKNQFRQPCGELMPIFAETESAFITENNNLFLEELIKHFPLPKGKKTNYEVQRLMLYLQDINHSAIPNKKAFLNEFLKDVKEIDNILANDGTKLYQDNSVLSMYTKKAILQAKYNNSERYKDITDLISLYKKGLVPKHNVEIFFPEAQFHPLPKSDMQKLLRGESYYPQFQEMSKEAITKLEEGEVFSVGEKMFVKTQNGYEELKIDRTTYEKLFPPVERYAISQNLVTNCGKISSWNGMIKNPTSRIELYKMFEQTENGVIVNMTHAGYLQEFKWNELPDMYRVENLQGSLGWKMLEYTYDMNKTGSIISHTNQAYPELITDILCIKQSAKEQCYSAGELEIFCNEHKNGIYVKNGWEANLNIGDIDGHYYSTTDLSSGKWQNPWTGIEELLMGKDAASSGSLHDF